MLYDSLWTCAAAERPTRNPLYLGLKASKIKNFMISKIFTKFDLLWGVLPWSGSRDIEKLQTWDFHQSIPYTLKFMGKYVRFKINLGISRNLENLSWKNIFSFPGFRKWFTEDCVFWLQKPAAVPILWIQTFFEKVGVIRIWPQAKPLG